MCSDSEKIEICKLSDMMWTPVRTKPRHEKKLAEYCKTHSVPFYLPLKKSVRRYKRQTVEFRIPMFPGYIFCALSEESYRTLLVSGAIVYRITMNEQREEVLIKELDNLQDFERLVEAKDVVVRPEIVAGVSVVVKNGPLHGLEGVVVRRGDSTVLTVNVELLGQSVSTVIDIEDIELDE